MAYDYERDVKARSSSGEIDLGLKAYMNKVYSFMDSNFYLVNNSIT